MHMWSVPTPRTHYLRRATTATPIPHVVCPTNLARVTPRFGLMRSTALGIVCEQYYRRD